MSTLQCPAEWAWSWVWRTHWGLLPTAWKQNWRGRWCAADSPGEACHASFPDMNFAVIIRVLGSSLSWGWLWFFWGSSGPYFSIASWLQCRSCRPLSLLAQTFCFHHWLLGLPGADPWYRLAWNMLTGSRSPAGLVGDMAMGSSRVNLQKGQNEKEKWPFSCEDKYKQNNSANLVHPWYAQDPKMFPQMIFVLKTWFSVDGLLAY